MRRDLASAVSWSRQRSRQLFIGEFGTIHLAAAEDRAAWTAHVRTIADELDVPWCYWDFATDFGAYDPATRRWHEALTSGPPHDLTL